MATAIYLCDSDSDDVLEVNNNELSLPDKCTINTHDTNNDALSSGEENESPVVKRKRKTRRPKGRVAPDSKDGQLKVKASIYSNTVKECYDKIDSGLLYKDIEQDDSKIEIEDDNNNNDNNNNTHVSLNEKRKEKEKTLPRRYASKPIDMSHIPSKSDVNFCEGSPSPPPSPIETLYALPKRRPRQTKKQKQALANIQILKNMRQVPDCSRSPFFTGDVSFDGSAESSENIIEVKVRCRTGIVKFPMKDTNSFLTIFEQLASRHDVPIGHCLLFNGDEFIEPHMTLTAAKITVADIIDFGIKKPEEIEIEDNENDTDVESADSVRLQVQAKGIRQKFKVTILKSEPLLKVIIAFATKHNYDISLLKMYFDGELVDSSLTPLDFDMEDEDCIDMVVTN